MKRTIATMAAAGFVLAACGAPTEVAPHAAKLTVDFNWTSANKCSSFGPEIRVGNAPAGTTGFWVALKDLDKPDFDHGGNAASDDGSGVIKAGAIKWTGPCPPSGNHDYEVSVDAFDLRNVIIGRGKKTKPCCAGL